MPAFSVAINGSRSHSICFEPTASVVRGPLPEAVEDQHGHREEVLGDLALGCLQPDLRRVRHLLLQGQGPLPEAAGLEQPRAHRLLHRLRKPTAAQTDQQTKDFPSNKTFYCNCYDFVYLHF